MKYIKPEFKQSGFHCPHCEVYAKQTWGDMIEHVSTGKAGYRTISNWDISLCDHCEEFSFWKGGELIYPNISTISSPNEDLDVTIKNDYNEASSIVEKSPKAAVALLRLAIQKLCKQLGEKGDNINYDIGELVKKGLPIKIQQALDIVRVVGNESVHPGNIDLNDNKDTAYKLFELINLIAETMITQPKEIDKMYSKLPEEKIKGISERDNNI